MLSCKFFNAYGYIITTTNTKTLSEALELLKDDENIVSFMTTDEDGTELNYEYDPLDPENNGGVDDWHKVDY
jgi:hypothetical protein